MKNIIVKIMVIAAVFTFAFVSCEKEDVTTKSEVEYKAAPTQPPYGPVNIVATWYDNGDKDYGCKGNPTDCLSPVIIVGFQQHTLINNMQLLSSAGKSADLKSYVIDHSDELTPIFSADVVKCLKVSELKISAIKNGIGCKYFVFENEYGKMEFVMPIKDIAGKDE